MEAVYPCLLHREIYSSCLPQYYYYCSALHDPSIMNRCVSSKHNVRARDRSEVMSFVCGVLRLSKSTNRILIRNAMAGLLWRVADSRHLPLACLVPSGVYYFRRLSMPWGLSQFPPATFLSSAHPPTIPHLSMTLHVY